MDDNAKKIQEESSCSREEASRLSSRVLACQKEMLSLGKANSSYPLTDSLISDYLPFIKSLIRTYVLNYKKYDFDSFVSVSTEAFFYAIKKYSQDSGVFICFAALVIKRRLLNEVAAQNTKSGREVNFSTFTTVDDDGNEKPFDIPDDKTPWNNPLKWEIDAIKTESLQYGIDFFKLNRYSPKSQKTKFACFAAVKYLIHSDGLLRDMRRKSFLPLNELCEATGIARKTLERHRQYIMVVALIGTDDYPYLQSWLDLKKYGVLP